MANANEWIEWKTKNRFACIWLVLIMECMDAKENKRGPKPEHVKIDGDWESAVSDSLKKKCPKDGWLKEDKKPHD